MRPTSGSTSEASPSSFARPVASTFDKEVVVDVALGLVDVGRGLGGGRGRCYRCGTECPLEVDRAPVERVARGGCGQVEADEHAFSRKNGDCYRLVLVDVAAEKVAVRDLHLCRRSGLPSYRHGDPRTAPFCQGMRMVSGPGGSGWLWSLQKPSFPQFRAKTAHWSVPPASARILVHPIAIAHTGWDPRAGSWAARSPPAGHLRKVAVDHSSAAPSRMRIDRVVKCFHHTVVEVVDRLVGVELDVDPRGAAVLPAVPLMSGEIEAVIVIGS